MSTKTATPPAPPRWGCLATVIGRPDVRIVRGQGAALTEAHITMRRRGDATEPPQLDATAALTDDIRKSDAAKQDRPALTELLARKKKLADLLSRDGARLTDLGRRRAAVDLDAEDLGAQIDRLDKESAALSMRQRETKAQLARAEAQFTQIVAGVRNEYHGVAAAAAHKAEQAREAKRGEIIARLSAAAAPILEELYALDEARRARPDFAATVAAVLHDQGLAPAPPSLAVVAAPDGEDEDGFSEAADDADAD